MRDVKIFTGRRRGESGDYLALYASDLVLYGKSEEDLRVMERLFVEMCRKRGLNVSEGKSMVMILNGEEGLECEVHVDRIRLEHVLEFKYLRSVLDESGTDGTECSRKVAGTIRCLVNARDLQLHCTRILYETLLVPVLIYDSERMLWN